jgi:hypothetical protein
MATYKITSTAGIEMGTYEAQGPRDALSAMARDAGYDSEDHAAEVAGPFEGIVENVATGEQTRFGASLR